MKNNLPNFLIVGAAKCGTSSLHNYLNQHPDIFMPSYNKLGMKVKEPRFLISDIVPSLIPSVILLTGFIFLGHELITERLGMMFIPFLLYDLYNLYIVFLKPFLSLYCN